MDDRRGVRRRARRDAPPRAAQRPRAHGGQARRDNQYGPYIAGFVVVVAALASFLYIGLNWATGPGRVAALASPPTAVATVPPTPPLVAPAAPPPSPAPTEQIYIVKSGDSPASIAQQFRVKTDDLIAYNNIQDPQKLQIGQTLRIPPTPPG